MDKATDVNTQEGLQEGLSETESEVFNHFLLTWICCSHWTECTRNHRFLKSLFILNDET